MTEIERQDADREKTGVALGRFAINPRDGERMPVWTADYVLADYGHGAVMAVPAHDQRDLDFARAFDLPVQGGRRHERAGHGRHARDHARRARQRDVPDDLASLDPRSTGEALTGDGRMINSGPLDGLSASSNAIGRMIELLEAPGIGRAAKSYRLRDWLDQPSALLGHAHPDRPHGRRAGGAGAVRAAARHAARLGRPRPVAEGHEPARRGRGLGERAVADRRQRPRAATPTRWTRSSTRSWYFLRFLSPNDDTQPFDQARGREAGRRSTATSAASSTRSCTCCTRASSRRCSSTSATCRSRSPSVRCSTRAWSSSTARRCRSRRATSSRSPRSSSGSASTRCGSTMASPARRRTTSTGRTSARPVRRSSSRAPGGCRRRRSRSPAPTRSRATGRCAARRTGSWRMRRASSRP